MNSIHNYRAKEEAEASRITTLKTIYNKICTIARARMAARINTVRRMKTQALKAYTGD
jgi:hypothetical protein